MATRAPSRRRPGGVQDRAQAAAKGAAASWARFTWATDTHRAFGAIPHVLLNWVVAAGLALAWWKVGVDQWRVLAGATAAAFLYTVARASRWVPGTAQATLALYQATAKTCGHPTITRTQPVDPRTRVRVTRWADPKAPRAGEIVYSGESAAAQPSTRWGAEKSVEGAVDAGDGQVVFDADSKPGVLIFEVVPADDPRVAQKSTLRWVQSTVAQIIPVRRASGNSLGIDVEWAPVDPAGPLGVERPDVPAVVTVDFGAHDMGTRAARDDAEARFDQAVTRGVEWSHDWSVPGQWTITATHPSSDTAVRKRTARKVASVALSAVQRAGGVKAAQQAEVTVTGWTPDNAAPAVRNTPVEITVDLGLADFSNPGNQHQVEGVFDQALAAEWPDRVWLPSWRIGGTTTLVLKAVPANHTLAQQKKETLRLRSVAQQKFRAKRGEAPTDVHVTEWEDRNGVQRAHRMTVTFGTADVTDPEKRRAFMDHFDSLTSDNDWRYDWDSAQGRVEITSVPVLAPYLPFPEQGTETATRWHEEFRAGRIILGPAKGGYEAAIDLSKSPHVLVGGSTGAGKSVLLTMVLYGALMNPDVCELVVVDPKVTDFTWTPGYPNVRMYAVTDVRRSIEEIAEVTAYAEKAMNARQSMLRQYGVENLGELRRGIREGRITDITVDDVPRRLIVFFDEGGAAFTPVKDPDLKAVQDASRTNMEKIGMLGRAMEVNIVMAAQKPSAENVGTAMRAQLVNRVAVGKLNSNESIQVLGSTLASDGLDGAPKGRGWFVNDAGQELLFQSYFLPKRDTPDMVNPTVTISGVQERVAARLADLGWTPIDTVEDFVREDEDGKTLTVQVPGVRWVRLDRVEDAPAPDEQATAGAPTGGPVPAGTSGSV